MREGRALELVLVDAWNGTPIRPICLRYGVIGLVYLTNLDRNNDLRL